jgi:hypothetical protein
MSPDTLTQLRAYATQLDDQAPSLHQLMPEAVETSGLQPMSSNRSGWVAAAMAAAAVMVMIGGVALLSILIGSSSEPIDEPPSTTAITTPQLVPDAGVEWARVPDPTGEFTNATIVNIVAGPSGLVAVGNVPEGIGVWTSVDAITWSRVPHDEATFGPGEDRGVNVSAAAAGEPGIVVLGVSWKEDIQTPLAWFSPDGSAWTRVPLAEATADTTVAEMRAVAAGGPGFVAVGWACDTGAGCDPWEPYPMVWTSVDGNAWTPIDNAGESFTPQTVLTEIVGYNGTLWAFGRVYGDDEDVWVWTSTNGLVWERATDDSALGGPGNQGLSAAAAGEGGVVAAGFSWTEENGTEPVSWYSPDGSSWTRVEHDFDLVPSTTVWDMTADGTGFVAVGDLGDWALEQGDPLGFVLRSDDGVTWELVNDTVFSDSQLMAVSVGGPGLVAGGGAPADGTAPIWVNPPGTLPRTEPTTPPTTSTTVLTAPVTATGEWTRWPVDPDIFGTGGVNDVVAGGPGLIAVGGTFASCGGGLDPCSGAVWLSDDGIIWDRLDDASGVFQDAWFIRAVTAGDSGLVAVGDGASGDPLVWFSPYGMQWSRSVLPNGNQVFDVVSTDTGYVAVGRADRIQGDTILSDGAVWTSPDGITWNQIAEDAATFADAYLMAITETDQGLVAVGVLAQDTGFGVWTSPDGNTWTKRVVDTSFPGPMGLFDVTEGTPGVLTAGVFGGLWLSPDGVTWQDVADPDFRVRSVAPRGDGFVAVGDSCDDTGCTTAVWTSPDGITWNRETPEPGFFDGSMTTVRAAGPGLVAFSILHTGPGEAAGIGHWTWGS